MVVKLRRGLGRAPPRAAGAQKFLSFEGHSLEVVLPMAQPPPQVLELVQRFDRNREAYRSPHYNETQVRREFLDPFFKATAEEIKIVEDSV